METYYGTLLQTVTDRENVTNSAPIRETAVVLGHQN
jgi:hypothetical protein